MLVELLGEGGMGAVYRAVQPAIGAEVAIKVLHATSSAREPEIRRLLLEAQAVNRVRHPGLVKIVDTGYLADRRPFLVMELLDGVALADVVPAIPAGLACLVALEALEALEAVHAEGIIHRDLKPANVFVTRDGRVVVLDFGIAKLVDSPVATDPAGLVGTPAYMAPEQIRGQPIDRRIDVYAIGILLYEAITRHRPFAAAVTFDLLVQHLERPPRAPREYVPDLDPRLDAAILRALAKDPAQRFATAAELASALRAVTTATRAELAAFVAAHTRAPRVLPLTAATVRDAERAAERELERATERPADQRLFQPTMAARPRISPAPSPPRAEPWPRAEASPQGDSPPAAEPVPRRSRVLVPAVVLGAGLIVAAAVVVARERGEPRAVVVDAAGPAGDGTVRITSDPPGAAIAIDHVARGAAPLTLQIAPGAHYLHADLDGRTADEAIDVRAGTITNAMVVLPALAPVPVPVPVPDAPHDVPKRPPIHRSDPPPVADPPHADPPAAPAASPRETPGTTGRPRKQNPFPLP